MPNLTYATEQPSLPFVMHARKDSQRVRARVGSTSMDVPSIRFPVVASVTVPVMIGSSVTQPVVKVKTLLVAIPPEP